MTASARNRAWITNLLVFITSRWSSRPQEQPPLVCISVRWSVMQHHPSPQPPMSCIAASYLSEASTSAPHFSATAAEIACWIMAVISASVHVLNKPDVMTPYQARVILEYSKIGDVEIYQSEGVTFFNIVAVNCTPFRPDSWHKQKGSSTCLRIGLCPTSIDALK